MARIRTRFAVIFVAPLGLSSKPASAEDRFATLRTCADNASHVEQRECLEAKMKESLAALGEAQRGLMKKLQALDQGKNEKNQAVAAAHADAQAYVGYSHNHCESFATLAFGGNSQQDRRLACHIELNAVRAQQLATVASSLP